MVFFQWAPNPFRGHEHNVGASIREPARDFRKPQVVTGLQSEAEAIDIERARRIEFTRFDPVGFALAEGVVEMHLSVVRAQALPRDCHHGVAHASAVGGTLKQASDHRDLVVRCKSCERHNKRPIERLGVDRE